VTASDNTLFGARLDGGGDVTVTTSDFSIVTLNSPDVPVAVDNFGLEVIADGSVFLDEVTLNNNATFGANVQAGGSVFLDAVTATNNGTNGVEVEANCTSVFLINGTYTGNGQYGLSILNGALNRTGGVFANNGLGEIFQDPGTCVFPTTPPPAIPPTTTPPETTPPTQDPVTTDGSQQNANSLAQTVRFAPAADSSLFKSASGTRNSKNAVTLNSVLASGTQLGLFTGLYTIIYAEDGSIQSIVLSPNSLDELALAGS
jgi:hypothetical protein